MDFNLIKPNNLSFPRKCLINFLMGSLSVLSLEPINFFVVLFFTIPIYIFNFDALNDEKNFHSRKIFFIKCFLLGMSFGYGFYFFSLYWINIALLIEIEVYYLLLLPSLLFVPLALSVFYGLSTLLLAFFYPRNITRIFIVAIAWTISEYLRISITDFPWAQIGHSLIYINTILQIISIFGELFLTTLTVIIFSMPLILILNKSPELKYTSLLISLFVLLGIITFGLSRPGLSEGKTGNIEINIIQPNIKQTDKWDRELAQVNLNKLISATIEMLNNKEATLGKRYFIWPETATPYLINENLQITSDLAKNMSSKDYLLVGSLRREGGAVNNQSIYNSLFMIDWRNKIIGKYDKNKLVPFGEYLPFSHLLSKLGFLNFEQLSGNFSNGQGGMTVLDNDLIIPHVLICYEIIFSEFLHSYNQKTNFILNVTNDAWFGRSSGPYQHFSMSILRAVERGLPVVRVANTGISGVIDPFGRVIIKSKLNTEYYNKTILPQKTDITFYTKYGYIPLFSILLLCFLLIYYSNKKLISKNKER